MSSCSRVGANVSTLSPGASFGTGARQLPAMAVAGNSRSAVAV